MCRLYANTQTHARAQTHTHVYTYKYGFRGIEVMIEIKKSTSC